jgi:hypothetical protein
MALSRCAVSELLDEFRTGDGVDLTRESVRMVMQELIEAEATEKIGAARYERIDTRITERNGSRDRLLATQAGDVELRIPNCAAGRTSRSSSSRAAASTRPSAQSSWRPTSAASPPGPSTTWSPPSASTRGSPSRRSRGSAPASTRS